ncbi:hypothetical protein Q1695_009578 [Nippostrongylus brasiliensis]|nr:hypothetical protein Q1695_009578 [Nippostrongylus brasiliensis]
MLFTGGTAAKPKRDERKEKKSDRDDKHEIQESVYVRWGNSLLANEPLKDFRDLCDVKYMSSIASIATGTAPMVSGNRLDDCAAILACIGDTKTSPIELADSQQKAVLSAWWSLVNAFWKKFGPDPIRDDKLSEAMRQWCVEVTKDYEAVSVCDFTSSWRDGYAFNCLLHNFDEKLVDLDRIAEVTAMERIENAFAVAQQKFQVARLLQVRDLHSEHLDSHSVVCYLMTLYLSLIGKSSIIALQGAEPYMMAMPQERPAPILPHQGTAASSSADDLQRTSNSSEVTTSSQVSVPAPVRAPSPPPPPPPPPPPEMDVATAQPVAEVAASPQKSSKPPPIPVEQQCTSVPSTSLGAAEQSPRAKKHPLQSSETTEAEMRSRKSSSSSQRSSKSKRARKEELTREFENCLEQVLTWLLEAEEELSLMEEVETNDLKAVRKQFKDFEQFMSSLTDSQDTVGRVLARGQLLCGKAESEEERAAIEGQLRLVNGRWESLRELSMRRQNALQTTLNQLQNRQLVLIDKWLNGVEFEMTSCEPLASTHDAAIRQIEAHTRLQSKIHAFQDTINDLSCFVAVVDEGDSSDERVGLLEQRLQTIGERWRAVCEWAEVRAAQLDGLAELCAHTIEVFDTLNVWLKEREHELLGLKSAHHLEDPEQVAEQVRKLQRAEAALEAEHGSFVRLSQLSCELVARLEKGNGAAANDVRRRLDTVTQRWDNLVARIEEHSRMLVQSGKADVRQLKHTAPPAAHSSGGMEQGMKADRFVKANETSLKVTTLEAIQAERGETTSDTEDEEAKNQVLERFLRHVAKLTAEMEPLRAWSSTFQVSKKSDQVRKMISVCQEKLIQIKDQEAKVNRLQLELEHMHLSSNLTPAHLKKANDAFEKFAKGWARIVTKISEAMNVLTGHDEGDEETLVAKGIEQWIEGCDKVLCELVKLPVEERTKRVAKLQQQLLTQDNNLSFIEKDPLKKAILKKGLDIVRKRIAALAEEPTTSAGNAEQELNQELDGEWCTVGDVEALDKEVQRAERAVNIARQADMSSDIVEKAETKKAEMEERRRATHAAHEKMKAAEDGLQSIAAAVEATSSSNISLTGAIVELRRSRDRLASYETLRKEAERAAEKMLALDDNVPQTILTTTRTRIRELGERWKELENTIEDHLSCARKEQRRLVQKTISNEERLLEQLEKRLADSERASDAEECCEHLDNLETLLEKVSSSLELDDEVSSMDESFVRDSVARLNESRQRLATATRERIAALSRAVADCERFEKQMADMQQWSSHVSSLLDLRKSGDVSALDVPDEYKELSKEFSAWSTTLDEIGVWLQDGERRDNERFNDQYAHAKNTFAELSQKFGDFKHPKSFAEKLERTAHVLGDIENALDDMTGIEAIFCGESLSEARLLVKKLITLEEDVHSLEKGKEQLIQEGIFDKESAAPFTEKIRLCKKKTKELGLRAEDAVERLEDCVEMYGKLLKESEAVEEFLDNLEHRLEKYAQEDKTNDEEVVDELVSEWNRHEASLRSLEELERLLRENAVKVSEAVYAEKRRRADALKMRLDGWSRTVQEMNNDEETLLMQVDELHAYLVNELDKVKDKEPEEIASSLRFLRGDRDRLSSRARKLAAINPRMAQANLCGDVTERWQQLESQLHAPNSAINASLGPAELNVDLPFHEKIDLLKASFDKAKASLDFDAAPVSNVVQWERRLRAVDDFLTESRTAMDDVIDKGRSLANSGRMELDTHRAIEKLDDIVDIADQLEMELESQRAVLDPLLARAEAVDKDREAAEAVVDALAERNLKDPAIAKATRQDLADRDAQFADLSHRAAEIHAALPGKSSASRDMTLAALGEKLARLESLLVESHNSQTRSIASATPIKTSPDRTSTSSVGPLAMEVGNVTDAYTTEEEMKDEQQPVSVASENGEVQQARKEELTEEHKEEAIAPLHREPEPQSTEQEKPKQVLDALPEVELDEKPKKATPPEPVNEQEGEKPEELNDNEPLEVIPAPQEAVPEEAPKPKVRKILLPSEPSDEISPPKVIKNEESVDGEGNEPQVSVAFTQPTMVTMDIVEESNGVDASPIATPPPFEMEQVYTNLDTIEEALAHDNQYPMEAVDDYEERYAKMSSELDDALQKVDEHQMTMDVLEVSHTQERIAALKKDLEERKRKAADEREEWLKLQNVLFEAEKGVAMGDKAMDRFSGRQASPRLEELEERQQAVEELLPHVETLVCDASRRLAIILPRLGVDSERAVAIRNRTRDVETRFRDLVRAAREARVRLDARAVDQNQLKHDLENLQFWFDETAVELDVDFNPYDMKGIEEAIKVATAKHAQIAEKKTALVQLENAKERLVAQASVDPALKHEVRRGVSEVAKRIADLRSDLVDRQQALAQIKRDCEAFWRNVDDMARRGTDLQRRCQAINDAVIFTPSPDHVLACRSDAAALRNDIADIKQRVQRANAEHVKLGGKSEKKIVTVITTCNTAIQFAAALAEPPVSTDESLHDSSYSQGTVVETRRDGAITQASTAEMVEEEDGALSEEDTIEPEYQGTLESVTGSSSKDDDRPPGMPRLHPRDATSWQSLTQLRHWLNELERDASLTVDLCDRNAIREMTKTVQGIMDHIRAKILDVVGIQDASGAEVVKRKARELVEDMDRVARQCDRRRATLQQLGEQSRVWSSARDAVELWMQQSDELIGHKRTEESTDEAMREELKAIEGIIAELEQKKAAINDVNAKGNAMLDTYTRDEAHTLSHELSKLNMKWSKFNDNLRIRRAVLEATQRSRSDFHTAFADFEDWLGRIGQTVAELEEATANTQSLKDTAKRRDWIQQHKALEAELDAHESVLKAVDEMGRKLGAGLDSGKDRSEINNRLDSMAKRWADVRQMEGNIKNRLAEAEQEWEKLTNTLSNLISWIEDKSIEMLAQQPVGGSLSAVMAQGAWMKTTEKEMEQKGIQVREAISSAHSFLMQHDLRPKMHRTGVLADDDEADVRDVEQRRCGLQIHVDCEKLKKKWAELGVQFADWDRAIHAAALRLQELERALAECQLHLSSVESEMEHLRPVERLRLEELKDARRVCESLANRVADLRIHVDDANDACGRVLAADTPLDHHPRNQLDSVNQRFLALKTALRVRSAALRNALTDFGPSSEHFLNQSVALPWQRAISKTNQLPYYIDHTTEKTQWEHPVWVEMAKELSQFNRVKFIAYRTAMKLRALQKRLCLDLVDIPMLEKCFSRLAGLSNEELPGLEGMVSSILPLFEQLNAKHPQMVRSVALAVDLCINFLLNLFDPSRDGILRVLSFKTALVVMSSAPLEEKYRFIFNLVAQDGLADQKHIALLLYDLIQIPRLVGEAAAFGGSNVEPSVRSCFETVRLAPSIGMVPFLEWMKQEPQSVVWLPVMHRLATAEFAKHQAKCNVCKMFPIIGLRYRCLRCFNLDLCQNCFFSQRTAKKHKLKHPMQEYAVPTTSSEDARDFARMVRNKFSRSKSSLGYLPVDVGDEGRPLTTASPAVRNPATEALHQRSAAIAHRLAELTSSQPAEPRDERAADVQSPAQLINQVDQMQKDELDQVLQRLQLENLELKRELERRKTATTSTPDLDRVSSPGRRSEGRGATLPRLSGHNHQGRSVPSLKSAQSQSDVMDEARALRLHKQRLEHRSRILEQQNEQLELQLQRLKKVIEQQKENGSRTDWSVERDWGERRSHPPFGSAPDHIPYDSSSRSRASEQRAAWEDDDGAADAVGSRPTRMQSLLATVDDLGRAMENLVVSVVYDSDQEQ